MTVIDALQLCTCSKPMVHDPLLPFGWMEDTGCSMTGKRAHVILPSAHACLPAQLPASREVERLSPSAHASFTSREGIVRRVEYRPCDAPVHRVLSRFGLKLVSPCRVLQGHKAKEWQVQGQKERAFQLCVYSVYQGNRA